MKKFQAVYLYLALWSVHPLQGQVNSTTAGAQQNPSIAITANGNYVIVWESLGTDGDDYGIYGQLYNSGGTKNGSEFRINTTTANGQRYPDVAIGDDGDFVVTWMSENQDGDSWGIYFQRYNASATAQGSETIANSTTTGIQRFPTIAIDNSENFVISWSQTTSSGTHSIQAQRFNSAGTAQGSEFSVNSSTADFHGNPDVGMARYSGDFAIVWQSEGVDNSGNGVFGQRYNSSGVAQGSEFRVNTEQSGHQQTPSLGMDSSGNFVVVWTSYGQDGSGYGVYSQRYNSSGTTQGSEFRVNSTTTAAQLAPSVAMSMEGGFLIAWAGFNSDGSQSQPYISGYDKNGNALTTESLFTTADHFQIAPSVAAYSESVNVVWAFQQGTKWGSDGDGDDFGIYAAEQMPGDLLFDALTLSSTSPGSGATGVDTTSNITATFDNNVLSSSITAANFRVWGEFSGLISGNYSGGGTTTITFNPGTDFFPGEKITVTLNTSLVSTDSKPLTKSHTFSFHAHAQTMSSAPANYNANTIAKEDGAFGIYPADLDGDGDFDIVGTTLFGSKVLWYQNDGSQSFSANTITSSANSPGTVITSDLDSDSDIDILYCELSGSIVWQKNDGSQNFTSQTIQSSLSSPADLIPTDLDADGDVDLLIATTGDSTVSWFQNDGSQSFTQIEIDGSVVGVNSIYTEDIDGDGDMDVLSASPNEDKIRWYENNGSASFTSHTITSAADGVADIIAIDLDNDGDMDVLSASKEDDLVSWYNNDGAENFSRTTVTNLLNDPVDLYAVDFDADGDIDICAAADGGNRIVWCENDGSESFTLHTANSNVLGPTRVFSADIDGNGYMDLLAASTADSSFTWYESETAFIWQGSSDTVWGTSGNWKSGSTPSKNDYVIIPSSLTNYPYLSVNAEADNLKIESGARITIKNGITLDLYGDLINESAMAVDFGDGLLKFSGSSEQKLSGSITANVEVNNSSNVKLDDNCTFKKVIFTHGNIDIGNHNLTHSGIAIGASSNSYFKISGSGSLLSELGSTSDTFHIGFNPYTPVVVSCPNCTGSESFEFSVSDAFYDDPVNSVGEVTTNVVTHMWKVVTTAARNVELTVQWNSSDESSGIGNDLFFGFWREGTNMNWSDSAGTLMTKSGSDPYTLTRTIRQINGTYHLAVGNGSSPLPVELTYFSADWLEESQSTILRWETATEVNNSHFEIQRSLNGTAWHPIGKLTGQSTSLFPTQYRFIDAELPNTRDVNTIYYRLKQEDFSGKHEYSNVQSVDIEVSPKTLSIYPNPVSSDFLFLEKQDAYSILSTSGQLIIHSHNTSQIDISQLPIGAYLIRNSQGATAHFFRI